MAKDAMRKREKAAEKRREAEEAWIKDEIDAHSFDDLKDEDYAERLATQLELKEIKAKKLVKAIKGA